MEGLGSGLSLRDDSFLRSVTLWGLLFGHARDSRKASARNLASDSLRARSDSFLSMSLEQAES